MIILVVNAGSSSLKYQLINTDSEEVLSKGSVERIGLGGAVLKHKIDQKAVEFELGETDHAKAIKEVFLCLIHKDYGAVKDINEIHAVGHRVVHGGEEFRESVMLDDEVMTVLNDNIDLAPLHNPANIACIKACRNILPHASMVGVFDTAFHSSIPPKGFLYAIPKEAYTKHKIRRYGFHGISHNYVSNRAAQMVKKDISELKIITCHLGNGSSIAAIKNGKVVDTSMGFTPLEGLIMGTRCGDIDAAVIQYLVDKTGMSLDEVIKYLNKKSGVLGISGISNDFRDLEMLAKTGNKYAELAIDMFCYRVKKYIGAYAAAMNGVDIIVFTAGIGENSSMIRNEIVKDMEYIGVNIDEDENNIFKGEKVISRLQSKVKLLVIPTNEELMIARDTLRVCCTEANYNNQVRAVTM